MGESPVRTHESRTVDRTGEEKARRRSAEDTTRGQVGDIHIEYKNNRHLDTNN